MKKQRSRRRKGNILILTAFLMVFMIALLAFAVDVGFLYNTRTQLQRAADSAAIAATWRLVSEDAPTGSDDATQAVLRAEAGASQYAGLNEVSGDAPTLAAEDVTVGYMATPAANMSFAEPGAYNAVQVSVRRTAQQNGLVPLFFARVLGFDDWAGQADATAMLLKNIAGFQPPGGGGGGNVDLLPFALDGQTWDGMTAGSGDDNWTWDAQSGTVSAGPDGIREVNLFPQGTGSPGNRGTVDIGSNNNSTADVARQILNGVSPTDFAYHGGKLELDEYGELGLNGDTGISAGVKDELASIIGNPRVVPLFSQVTGPGNNAQYTIVRFVGIRIMEVKLTGNMNSKRVIVQPASIVIRGGIGAPGTSPTSEFVYSPVWLVR